MDWILDLLTTYTHHSELQVITALSLVSALYKSQQYLLHVRWVPCHHGMACPQVVDEGDGLQIWKVAVNILNKHNAEKFLSSCSIGNFSKKGSAP
jgi:hypothetical protein